MENTRLRRNLGGFETIYEEEGKNSPDENTPYSISPVLSPSPAPLPSRLLSPWPLASEKETEVVIHVQGSCFHLHKGPLRAKSGYLKRLLKASTREVTISPPLNITPETFSTLLDYFHGSHIAVTPFNVAALRVAAESLEMSEVDGAVPGEDFRHITESYFRHLLAGDTEFTSTVLRSCVSLMPEAETTASLVSRCIEALILKAEGEGGFSSVDDVTKLSVENFQVVVESMNRRLTCHDLLYRTVDLYLKGHNGEITEEEKIRMCNYIDCTILSPQLLMHAVQNPRMPLRFVIQAMFLEQLNTRRTIFSSANHNHHNRHNHHTNHELIKPDHDHNAQTLGAILQRDAALRQVAQLKETMDSTRSKIQSLEKELFSMRRILKESESTRKENNLDSGRSQSFRIISSNQHNKVGRDQMGSVSSASYRFLAKKERGVSLGWSSSSEGSPSDQTVLPMKTKEDQKNLGRRLINGLKSAFGVSRTMLKKPEPEIEYSGGKVQGDGDQRGENGEIGDVDVVVIKKNLPFQRRSAHPL